MRVQAARCGEHLAAAPSYHGGTVTAPIGEPGLVSHAGLPPCPAGTSAPAGFPRRGR